MNTLSFQILIHLGNKLEAECDENIYSIPGPVGLIGQIMILQGCIIMIQYLFKTNSGQNDAFRTCRNMKVTMVEYIALIKSVNYFSTPF
jgi:hypothetical protein